MNWIETGYVFQKRDEECCSYLEDVNDDCKAYIYGFSNIPQLKTLIRSRLPGAFTENELNEICRQTFRQKPEKHYRKPDDTDRQVVDFIYQF